MYIVFEVDFQQDADSVNTIADSTKSQGELHPKSVDYGTTKEADNGKSAVQGRVLQHQ